MNLHCQLLPSSSNRKNRSRCNGSQDKSSEPKHGYDTLSRYRVPAPNLCSQNRDVKVRAPVVHSAFYEPTFPPSISPPIPKQEAGDTPVTPLGLRLSMDSDDYLLSGGSQARLLFENAK
ncbi:hypothetical protein EVAR_39441_1 [Eumeta japonica]|uniref:Uncharacterized protein n=1 Tax=Eumeta variegata TaxID=151549 RepID=A0A4C1W046_EUMVA|nr:hypothetical protein EVAR_39441_1 [Eumeta japonica]